MELSFEQMRVFIAAVEAGSFSAAGRRLNRAQSVVSQTIARLECQIGVPLFDRAGRYPVLTEAGRQLLADARAVTASMNALKARAKGLAAGVEAELSVAIDVMFPMSVLTRAAAAFGAQFPSSALRLYVEALGGVAEAVVERRCQLGVMGSLPLSLPELATERLLGVKMVFVAAPAHELAALDGPVPRTVLAEHVQLVLTDRTQLTKDREFSVFSPRTWRLADLGAKHEFLLAGLGWGGMPYERVARDLAEGRLREIALQDRPEGGVVMAMTATYRTDAPPGPAGRWFIEQLRELAQGSGCGR